MCFFKVLNIHNRYRAHHNAVKLSYDTQCELSAKKWAEVLSKERSCLIHEPNRKLLNLENILKNFIFLRYGENLFYFASPHYFTDAISMAEAVVHSFYIEKRIYNYNFFNKQGFIRYGHFTQMLWRSTQKLGVGVAIGRYSSVLNGICMPKRGSGNFIFVVIKYNPPGNVQKLSEYFENVKPFD